MCSLLGSGLMTPSLHTVKVGVGVLLVVGARPEVDELELARLEVHDEVLVLEVAVHDALAVAGQHGLHHLAEEAPSELLLQHPLLRDQVEQVLAQQTCKPCLTSTTLAATTAFEHNTQREAVSTPLLCTESHCSDPSLSGVLRRNAAVVVQKYLCES